jgi:acyl-CoA thioesterase FadM
VAIISQQSVTRTAAAGPVGRRPGPVAVGRLAHVYVDRSNHRPAAVPEVIGRALETLGRDPAENA